VQESFCRLQEERRGSRPASAVVIRFGPGGLPPNVTKAAKRRRRQPARQGRHRGDMVGETVSHYRILEELGGGAMGVVYRAQDLRLKRQVALKFLPPSLTRDPEAKKRFVQEAEAASALDDPHVCTIHDIDETADGRVFIAMALYEGETLKKRIQRGPMPVEEVIAIAAQIAKGLAAAHEAGIVHRDVKPANVMITKRGEVKIVDFGIAKLSGQADLTGTGLRLGTIAYMAPEQFEGDVDARADLWALGVVMFEMLASRRPFEAGDDLKTMNAVLNRAPQPLRPLRPDTPDALVAVVERAMQKNPAQRFASARDMAAAIEACRRSSAAPVAESPRDDTGAFLRTIRRPLVALPVLVVLGVLGYFVVSLLMAQSQARWARQEAIPEIRRLLQVDDYDAAYALAQRAASAIAGDPMLAELVEQATQSPGFTTKPDGARVSVKPYTSPQADWRLIGTTPLKGVSLPRGTYRWRIEADGFEPMEFARNVGDLVAPVAMPLVARGGIPAGMVALAASRGPVDISGFATEDQVALAPFFIDRYEVSNRQFKEFVDAGGYSKPEYWKHDFLREGRKLPFDEAMAAFRDTSGRPGPATWELGGFKAGQADFPVSGVSWYEAAAYAEFRQASLPTIYHWARAALGATRAAPIRGRIVEASNFAGNAAVAVGSTGALGPYGTYDMAGNVREWCANLSGANRWMLGGAWNDHEYMYVVPYSLPPMDRSAINGFRLARYENAGPVAELSKPIEVFRRDFRAIKPVSDEIFEVFKRQFAYTPSPVDAKSDGMDASSPDWTRESVTIDTGYGERMPVHIYVPKTGQAPRQAVVFVPGLTQFLSQSPSVSGPTLLIMDFVVKSGRMLVVPAMKGSYERYDGFLNLTGDRYLQTFRQRMHEWRQEMGQVIDYLGSRGDVRTDQIAYSGLSFGASVFLPVLAMEPRFKAATLILAGLSYRDMLPEVDAVNFVPRITIPVLMLEARYDHLFPVDSSQQPLMALLGSPPDRKRQVLFDAGHGPLPRGQTIAETLAWLDKYLGPPAGGAVNGSP
jgi:formylglycine-generating enzyme required for sulfatase activity/dienelactone hydrolase